MWTTSEFLNSLLVLVILLTWKERWKLSYKRGTELLFSSWRLLIVYSATEKEKAIPYLSPFQTLFQESSPCSSLFPRFLCLAPPPNATGYPFYLTWLRDDPRTLTQRREFSASDFRTSEDAPTSTNCPYATPRVEVLEHMVAKERHKHITYKCINRIQRRSRDGYCIAGIAWRLSPRFSSCFRPSFPLRGG